MKPAARTEGASARDGASGEPFTARLHERRVRLGTAVCLGIDPRPSTHPLTSPARLGATTAWDDRVVSAVREHFLGLLDATHDLIAACKPQSAFFEALGPAGVALLAELISHARHLGVPVVLDAKRGDIGSTAAAYAAAYLEDGPLSADALTVNPFLGLDTLAPFLESALAGGRALYVLVRTTNAGSSDLQGLPVNGGSTVSSRLAERLARLADGLPVDDAGYTPLGAVVGDLSDMAELRAALPRSPLLVPGYGAQGATADDVLPAFDGAGLGAVVSASRSLTYGNGFEEATTFTGLAEMTRVAVTAMRDEIEAGLMGSAGTT